MKYIPSFVASPHPQPVAMVDTAGITWWLASMSRSEVTRRNHYAWDADTALYSYVLEHPESKPHLAAIYVGMQALFGPSSASYDDYKGSFRWFVGVWRTKEAALTRDTDWVLIHDVRDHKGSTGWRWHSDQQEPPNEQLPWLLHGSVALLLVAGAVGEHLRELGLDGRRLRDFRLAIPAIWAHFGAAGQAWFWHEEGDDGMEPKPLLPPALGLGIALAGPVTWSEAAPDPQHRVWDSPMVAMILRLSLGQLCKTWIATCTNEADYLAKVREFLNDLQRPTEELPGGLTPAQVENLEAYGMQRWRHRA